MEGKKITVSDKSSKVGFEVMGNDIRLKVQRKDGSIYRTSVLTKGFLVEGFDFAFFITQTNSAYRVSFELMKRDLSFRAIAALVKRFPDLGAI